MGSTADGPGLTFAMGKNDFWGWPGQHVIFGGTFDHFSPGWLSLVVAPPGGRATPWNASAHGSVNSTQRLLDGRLTIDSVDDAEGGYGLHAQAYVINHGSGGRNTVMANFSASCPPGALTATVTANLSSDVAWLLPVSARRGTGTQPSFPELQLRKRNQPTPWHPVLLTPCDKNLLIVEGIRSIEVVDHNEIRIANGTDRSLCLATRGEDARVITVPCPGTSASGGSGTPPPSKWFWRADSGRVSSEDGKACVVVENTNSTACNPCPWGKNGGFFNVQIKIHQQKIKILRLKTDGFWGDQVAAPTSRRHGRRYFAFKMMNFVFKMMSFVLK